MKNIDIQYRRLSFFLIILGLFACIAHADQVEKIIKSQKELSVASEMKAKESLAQQQLLKETKDVIKMGGKEYERSCSLCHGLDGTGHGVYALVLMEKPADLTLIQKKNYGEFPYKKLHRIIDGREEIKSHGTRTMPIWGERFNSENSLNISPRYSETLVRGRIFELLIYLETIQK